MGQSDEQAYWSWSCGERGQNRVRVFEHRKSRMLCLEWFERRNGERTAAFTRSLGHADRALAKAAAEEQALKLRRGEVARRTAAHVEGDPVRPLRLGPLIDSYVREVTPRKSRGDHDRCAAALFVTCWGRERLVDSLCERDWRRFIDARRSGVLAPAGREGKRVGDRVVEHGLRWLLAVMNWACRQKDSTGAFWILANPLRGQVVPTEKNPRRPIITHAQYAELLGVAPEVDPRFALALVIAHETGHRLSSIRRLLWADVDFDRQVIFWRAETDKSGKAHETALTDVGIAALRSARAREARIGNEWVFRSRRRNAPLGAATFQAWWGQAADRAELKLPKGCRWHSFRRKLATELAQQQLAVVQALGGWAQPQVVVSRYQQVPLSVQREVLGKRRIG